MSSTMCMVLLCPNKGKIPEISYFKLTMNRQQAWLECLGLDPRSDYSVNNYVCSAHFIKEDINITLKGKMTLKPGSLPIMNLGPNAIQRRSIYYRKALAEMIDNVQPTEIKLEASESTANLEKFDLCQYEDLKIEKEEPIIKEEEEEEKVSIVKIGTLADLPKFLSYTQSLKGNQSCFLLPDATGQDNNAVRLKKIKQEENRNYMFIQDNTKNSSLFQNSQTICKSEFKSLNLQPIRCESPKVVPSKFKCDQCEYTTAHKVNLKVHRLEHMIISPGEDGIFKCDQCLYATNCKNTLFSHLCVNNRKLKCDQCTYATDYPRNLKMHLLKHKNPKKVIKFKCDQCKYASLYKCNLKKHVLKHKEPKEGFRYKCEQCKFSTVKKSSLNKHIFKYKNLKKNNKFKCDQ